MRFVMTAPTLRWVLRLGDETIVTDSFLTANDYVYYAGAVRIGWILPGATNMTNLTPTMVPP